MLVFFLPYEHTPSFLYTKVSLQQLLLLCVCVWGGSEQENPGGSTPAHEPGLWDGRLLGVLLSHTPSACTVHLGSCVMSSPPPQ